MRYYTLHNEKISCLGMGGADVSWGWGGQEAVNAYRYGLDHGVNLIDTAESYTGSEEVIGKAIHPYDRSKIFLVSKFLPQNGHSKEQISKSLHRSLQKLGTDYLDLYLLHWRADSNLAQVVADLEDLQQAGLIRHWGVSNFDQSDLDDLMAVAGGNHVFANEDLYNVTARGVEYDVLPWQRKRQIAFLAYSPFHAVGWQAIRPNSVIKEIADAHGVSTHQVLLAWDMRDHFVMPLPKASKAAHVKDNITAAELTLSQDELAAIDQVYPAPDHHIPLQKI